MAARYFARVKNMASNRREIQYPIILDMYLYFLGAVMRERDFQRELKKEIKKLFPDSITVKTDPTYLLGFPDLLIFNKGKWAALECKRSEKASKQGNQDIWIPKLDEMSYASFVYPENRKEVLNELQEFFKES